MPVEEITRERNTEVLTKKELEELLDEEGGSGKGKRILTKWRNYAGKFYEALEKEGIKVGSREQYITQVLEGLYRNRQKLLYYQSLQNNPANN